MKNILIISICTLILGCTQSPESHFIVAGNVKDFKISIVELSTSDTTYIDTIKGGSFLFDIPANSSKYINLKIKKKIPLYVKPNDSVFVNYNKSNCIFSGRGFEESEFLFEKRQLIKKLGFYDPRKIDIELFSSETELFQAKIDSLKHIRIKQLEDFKELHPSISNSFYLIEKELIEYFVINQLFSFPNFHKMFTKNKPILPDNYYSFVKHIKPNKKELFAFSEYKSTINSLLNFKTESFIKKYYLAKDMLTDSVFFSDIMYGNFHRYINFNGIDGIDSICIDFINQLTNDERKRKLKSKYHSWKMLEKGEEAPNFKIKDDKGSMVQLSDFKGKIVYIDCWNSNCGPCIAEMPSMKKLSEKFANKDIVFICISSDKDTKRWLNKLKEFNLNTINLCTEGARHKFNNDYNAKAFPRYILIDKNGLIIDATAHKPSVITGELNKLLQ